MGAKIKTVTPQGAREKVLKVRRQTSEDSVRQAAAVFDAVVALSGVEPTGAVLDVGCGAGRLAVLFSRYLAPAGSYTGLDIRSALIDELQSTIGAEFPNFRFISADVKNGMYNPDGRYPASEYEFPLDGEAFDLVFLFSVFTHMLPPEVERYLSEIERVLKPGGRCVISYRLLNEESQTRLDRGDTRRRYGHRLGVHRVNALRLPEDSVAYDETYIRGLYEKLGLVIVEPIAYGTWGRREGIYDRAIPQDLVTASKGPAPRSPAVR